MKIRKIAILAVLIVLVGLGFFYHYESRQPLNYQENLGETAVTVDGRELTLQDLAFYIVYEEGQIEQQAMIYNPDNTRDYWNLHVNGVFIQADAKNTVMKMAVHDEIFYQLAREKKLELTHQEEVQVENAITDFWMDLLDEQQDSIPVSDEVIHGTIKKIAYAQKYQEQLADENGAESASYSWDGYYYEQLLEKEHTVKIHKKIWDRLVMGGITLEHGAPNYVNGQSDQKEE